MKKLIDYFESLTEETNWFKMFIPVFIGMSIGVTTVSAFLGFCLQNALFLNAFMPGNLLTGFCVVFIFSSILAGIITGNHQKANITQ